MNTFGEMFCARVVLSQLMSLTAQVLGRQDDATSNEIIKLLTKNPNFSKLSENEGRAIIRRDQEDEEKLAKGIEISIKKGVLQQNPNVSAIKKISVYGKSADAVAQELLSALQTKEGEGNVIILQGLSGTGKGTTVGKLKTMLPKCMTWSNGNVFRAVTLLASRHCEALKTEFSPSVMKEDLINGIMQRLSFEKIGEAYDVMIDHHVPLLGIANTELKLPHISARVPTVAEFTQGEVVNFAAHAVSVLQHAGYNVILEGRAQTLNYIPTPNRFELTIEDPTLLGQRRAAQRVMAAASPNCKPEMTPEQVQQLVERSLATLV